jgi:competence protein ComEA
MKFQKIQKIKLAIAAAAVVLLAAAYVLGPGRKRADEEILLAETRSGEISGMSAESPGEDDPGTSRETSGGDSSGASGEASGESTTEADTLSPSEAAALSAVEDEEKDRLYVHVCGEVVCPGVYALSAGSRVFAAVDAAGGLTENAAGDYLNMAAPVTDGQQIRIPTKEEAAALRAAGGTGEAAAGGATADDGDSGENAAGQRALVNINTADAAELMTLPGIGESRARDIISWREKHKFGRIEDIMKVPGIKDGAFKKLKDRITV